MNQIMDAIRSIFQLRTCKLRFDPEPIAEGDKYDVCLQYHIDNCKGPCVGKQSHDAYMQTIEQVRAALARVTRRR